MNKQKQTTLGILIVIIIAIFVGFYIYKDSSTNKQNTDTSKKNTITVDTSKASTSTAKIGVVSKDKGYTVEVVPIKKKTAVKVNIPTPDLNRKIVFGNNVSKDAKKIIITKINSLESALKKDNSSLKDWIDLGLYRKVTGDYEGARQAWEYASALSPKNSISFRDLGDLYGYYLKEPQKAEKNLLEAIKNGPSNIEYYLKTADFYRYKENDISKARGIIKQGISANPKSTELKSFLTSLK